MRFLILMVLALSVTACVRPTGDFGRARSDVLHDDVLPTVGNLRALIFKEPVSGFNWTDQEEELHNRAWRFLIAPYGQDWFFDVLVEWQRTRILPRVDTSQSFDRYYNSLRWEKYRSSRVRYNRTIGDVEADIAAIPSVLSAICAVEDVDRQRKLAVGSLTGIKPDANLNVQARHAENQAYIRWFTVSARYRYESYSYALENLLVETPHEEARQLDARLSEYAIWVERAEAKDFCSGAIKVYGDETTPRASQSRVLNRPFTPDEDFRK